MTRHLITVKDTVAAILAALAKLYFPATKPGNSKSSFSTNSGSFRSGLEQREIADTLPHMNWRWRRRRQVTPTLAVPTERGSRYSVAVLETFLEQARATAAWHEARADTHERKASTLLGFMGVILVLLPVLRGPIANAHGRHMRMFLVGLAIVAAVLLALAALSAALVLLPRRYAEPGVEQLRKEWAAYTKEGRAHRSAEHLTGLFVDQLIRRTDPSPLETLRDDAKKRAWWVQLATWLVLATVLVLGGLTSALLVEGGA